jgi:subtilase family serine protease
MPRTRHLHVVSATATAGVLVLGGLGTAAPAQAAHAQAANRRSAIAGTHPAWAATPERVNGPAAVSGTVTARIYLAGRDPEGLADYATAVSTPGDALYHHYLTPAQVKTRFAATSSQVAALRAWLTSAGLTVTAVDDQNLAGAYIAAHGPVAAASKAFAVSFAVYRGPDGRDDRAPIAAATAPASLASAVLAVSGLDTASHLMKPELPPPGPNYWVAPPCSTYYGQEIATARPMAYGRHEPLTNCGYTPSQIRGAYGVTASGMTGKGQTVAIVGAYLSPTMPADANWYAEVTGGHGFRPGQYRQVQAGPFTQADLAACGAPSWYGEQTLDVEAVHGQAADANVRYVAAGSCGDSDLIAALALIVNRDLASIVSSSWGDLAQYASLNAVYDTTFEVGAAEGIGFFFSSGDSGYENPGEDPSSPHDQVDYPTSSPYVTSVGGTSLAIGKNKNYEWETGWSTLLDPMAADGRRWQFTPPGTFPSQYGGSSGGGVSTEYPQPAYQRGVVPVSLATHLPDGATSATPMRVVPDVSALADPSTGFLIGQTTLQPNGKTYAFSLSRIGGTSVSSPTFAGIEADAQQAYGSRLGFANPVIYARYGTAAFHDVTDHPAGQPDHLAEVRSNYTDPYTKTGPLITYLRTLGVDGAGVPALNAVRGYDDATGVGSPRDYIQSFRH